MRTTPAPSASTSSRPASPRPANKNTSSSAVRLRRVDPSRFAQLGTEPGRRTGRRADQYRPGDRRVRARRVRRIVRLNRLSQVHGTADTPIEICEPITLEEMAMIWIAEEEREFDHRLPERVARISGVAL